jgi:hypothetical protein
LQLTKYIHVILYLIPERRIWREVQNCTISPL